MIKLKDLLPENYEYPLATGEDLYSHKGNINWKGKIVYMTPDRFLELAYPLPDALKSELSLQKIRHRIINKLPLDPLVLDVNMEKNKVVGHEGRHRAMVAKELGIQKVPVFIFTGSGFDRVPKWSSDVHKKIDAALFRPELEK